MTYSRFGRVHAAAVEAVGLDVRRLRLEPLPGATVGADGRVPDADLGVVDARARQVVHRFEEEQLRDVARRVGRVEDRHPRLVWEYIGVMYSTELGRARERAPSCVNLHPVAKGNQEAGFTQPKAHSFERYRRYKSNLPSVYALNLISVTFSGYPI